MMRTDLHLTLRTVLEQTTHRWFERRILGTPLEQELRAATRHLPEDASLLERLHVMLFGEQGRECESGNRKPFSGLEKGWRYCGRQCECQRRDHAERMVTIHASRDQMVKASIAQKAAKTAAERGHENLTSAARAVVSQKRATGSLDEKAAAKKRAATIKTRYGTNGVLAVPTIAAKKSRTMRQRHGVEHAMQSPDLSAKARNTHLARYGGKDRMETARKAFVEQHGVNPSQVPEITARRKETLQTRYGIQNPSQHSSFRAKAIMTWRTRLGADNPLSSAIIKAKIASTNLERYATDAPVRAHIRPEHLAILDNKADLEARLGVKSVHEIATEFGVAPFTVYLRCQKHGIERPKSSYERAISTFLTNHGFFHKRNDRRVIAPLELDIVIPEARVAIEFCGLYWHNETWKDRLYHQNKMNLAREAGYRLVTIFEDEWLHRPEIASGRLRAILGIAPRGPGARNLEVVGLSGGDAARFLDEHHMQGAGPHGFARYGAIHDNKLIGVMTFTRPRITLGRRDGSPELLRFATDGRAYPGLASKLMAAFIRDHAPSEIISYADARWSDGHLYERLGFVNEGVTAPNYAYWRPNTVQRVARFKFRKDRLVAAGHNPLESEAEIMRKAGWLRIYDCGSLRFRWRKDRDG